MTKFYPDNFKDACKHTMTNRFFEKVTSFCGVCISLDKLLLILTQENVFIGQK